MLKDKVVIIASASRAVGFDIAKEIAGRGAPVFICSRNIASVQKSACIISREAYPETLDVTDVHGMSEFIFQMAERHKHIDILINNAGCAFERIIWKKTVHEDAEEDFERVIEVNNKWAFILSEAPIPATTKNNGSRGRRRRGVEEC